MSENGELRVGRRGFLKISAGGAAGLWLSLFLPPRADAARRQKGASFEPNAWLRVGTDGVVTVFLARAEMGQGVTTSLPMIVAEELEAEWKDVRVVLADADPKFGPMSTGGSRSVRISFRPLRQAGATARTMLVAAAARRWGVDPSSCRAESGQVFHVPTERRLSYGDLAADASSEAAPKEVVLKSPKDFRIVGTRTPRLDTRDKTTGKTIFGIDVSVPGLLHAVVARPPVSGGKVTSYDALAALRVPGVLKVVDVPSGVAVVARSTFAALKGREQLKVRFDGGPNALLDQQEILRRIREAPLLSKPSREQGDFDSALAAAAKRLEATYELPILAHATQEPMNATARVRKNAIEIWAPTQSPTMAIEKLVEKFGVPESAITFHVTYLGGGFGRRAMPDFVLEAAYVSKASGGVPIKVTWTREDDMRHDFYRPPGRNELTAGLDPAGNLVAWRHVVRSPSVTLSLFGPDAAHKRDRPDIVESAADFPYTAAAVKVEAAVSDIGLPLGWWRSVYASQNAFPEETFIDELAEAAGRDPVAFRLAHLPENHRLRGVLDLAARKAGWGAPLPPGRARGIACHSSFASYVAEVAEVSIEKRRVKVHRVVCAVDCGLVVNPDGLEAQLESAVVYGLSAALRGEITVKDGAVVEGNFDEYQPLRMEEMPTVEVHFVPSTEDPTGIGEPGLPPIAPAVVNALHVLTGTRIRRLPIGAVGSA